MVVDRSIVHLMAVYHCTESSNSRYGVAENKCMSGVWSLQIKIRSRSIRHGRMDTAYANIYSKTYTRLTREGRTCRGTIDDYICDRIVLEWTGLEWDKMDGLKELGRGCALREMKVKGGEKREMWRYGMQFSDGLKVSTRFKSIKDRKGKILKKIEGIMGSGVGGEGGEEVKIGIQK
ncbi:hypothetical protein EYC84_011025 [Monilinia fructicola]|uniref:Uncharacterized protein n=1 Tax=Monilinia fructicola TaxID=38448 RepID=A0A5M9JAD4_MONFR|nr:hypothetical protein EYC84_011025 [Monilinia fructicola]